MSLGRLCVLPVMHIMTLGHAAALWSTLLQPMQRGELWPSHVLPKRCKGGAQAARGEPPNDGKLRATLHVRPASPCALIL